MKNKCQVCKKGKFKTWKRVKLRGKYNPTVKKFQKPNLHWLKLKDGKRILVCTKCRRKLLRSVV